MGRIDLTHSGEYSAPDTASLPVLATRNLVLFPGVAIPIALIRPSSLEIARKAEEQKITIGLCCQMDTRTENPSTPADVAPYGVFVEVLQIFELPDGTKSAFLRATGKFKVKGQADIPSMPGSMLNLTVSKVAESKTGSPATFSMLAELIQKAYKDFCHRTDSDNIQALNIETLGNPVDIINTIATHFPAPPEKKMELLGIYRTINRGEELLRLIEGELQKLSLASDIMERAREELTQEQREVFMRRQMEVMQRELYGDIDDVEKLTAQADEKKLPKAAREAFDKGIAQLRRVNPSAPDYSVIYNYLTTILDLPWNDESPLNNSLPQAREILEQDHFGMTKVKERIVEQVAVAMANPEGKAPILCLVGAPGVGKTSLGVSVAKALGREYQRVSLGGVSDEAEIRGHRRTYIGSMPGRIIQTIKRCGSSNPVIILDEVDKVTVSNHGDPSSALLEVLDPEQNTTFHDNYLDMEYDLSKVLFIATANNVGNIAPALRDRMEMINIAGYLPEEKIRIALEHLLPKQREAHGIKDRELILTPAVVDSIIAGYTREAGVRALDKLLAKIARARAKQIAFDEAFAAELTPKEVETILGKPKFLCEEYDVAGMTGVVTGLAWTEVGGDILYIESVLTPGKGGISLTGNLGDVMKESATIACEWVKAHHAELGIDPERFEKNDINIHVPEGAIPKDGPSAGITMVTSIVSTYTGRKVKERIAMTGETTLRGRVMPVGGIKEKILAAKRAGIRELILSEENRKDIAEIKPEYVEGLVFHYVRTNDEVLALALE